MRESLAFQKVQAYCATNWGRQLLLALEERHRFAFPAYFSELQGLAAGSGVPLDEIFMLNLRQEILAAGESPEVREAFLRWLENLPDAPASDSSDGGDHSGSPQRHVLGSRCSRGDGADRDERPDSNGSGGDRGGGGDGPAPHVDPLAVDACSDVGVRLRQPGEGLREPRILLGHNEDMTKDTLGHMYYIRATLTGRGSWFALTYAGELASTAFGANSAGVAFTLNALYPRKALLPGLGRNFLSRRLLDAGGVEEALRVLAEQEQATGRSVNLMSTRPPLRVWNVEVGPGGGHDVMELYDNAWYYHANAYMRLPQPQKLDNSSVHREARFAQFPPPRTADDLRAMLGDTHDAEFPIYRTGDYGGLVYTLCTVLYDLSAHRMTVYQGNPQNGQIGSVLNLDTLMPLGPYDAVLPKEDDGGERVAEAAEAGQSQRLAQEGDPQAGGARAEPQARVGHIAEEPLTGMQAGSDGSAARAGVGQLL